jgi:hypothetical protein
LLQNQKKWTRNLLRILRACDRRQVSELAVADRLANLSYEVHLNDKTVGPRSIVAWRHRKGGVRNGGGSQQFYTGIVRDGSSAMLPTIGQGGDIAALVGVMMPRYMETFEALRRGETPKEWSKEEINAVLARIRTTPYENLR